MRRRLEMGEMDAVRRIPTVKGKDYNPRQNAHRLAVEQDLWAEARPGRLEAQRKRGPSNPANRKPLNVQLFVTRYRSSVRQWPQIEALLDRLNQIFLKAQIVFQLIEPAECNRSVSYAQRCPFGHDLDHAYEWLHLAVVPRLPDELPVLTSCGRCCLISDRSQDQDVARILAQSLGLDPQIDLDFREEHIQWLRWQAFLLQGQAVPLPLVSLPVWVYPVVTPDEFHSQRGLEGARQLLERVNLIWLQAGITLELAGCCPLHQHDLGSEAWEQALSPAAEPLLPITRFGRHSLHFPLIRAVPVPWSCFAFPEQRLCLIRDGVTTLSVAQALGRLLGLTEVAGLDQLMSVGAEGNRLGADEVRRARQRAQELTGQAVDTPILEITRRARDQWLAPEVAAERPVEFNLILLRGPDTASRLTLQQAEEWLQEVAGIWRQAGILLHGHLIEAEVTQGAVEAAYPNPGGPRKPSCAGLTRLPGYVAGRYNLCVLHQLPVVNKVDQFQAYLHWPGPRLTLLAEEYAGHGQVKQLALALAVAWGVKPGTGSFERLLTRGSQGIRLGEEDRAAVLSALAGPTFAPPSLPAARPQLPLLGAGKALSLPIKLRRVLNPTHACALSVAEVVARLEDCSFWQQANIQLRIVDSDEVEVSDAALCESFPVAPGGVAPRIPFNFGLLRLPGNDPVSINLLLVGQMPGGNFSSFSLSKMVVADPNCAAAGVAHLLGVNLRDIAEEQVKRARDSLLRLFPSA